MTELEKQTLDKLKQVQKELETDKIEIPFEAKINKINVSFKYHKALPNYEYIELFAGLDLQELFQKGFESCRNEIKKQLENIKIKKGVKND